MKLKKLKKISRIFLTCSLILSVCFSFYLGIYNSQRTLIVKQDKSFPEKEVIVYTIFYELHWDGEDNGGSYYTYNVTYKDGLFTRGCRVTLSDKYDEGSKVKVNIQDHIGANVTLFRFLQIPLFLCWTLTIIINVLKVLRSLNNVEDSEENAEDIVDKV